MRRGPLFFVLLLAPAALCAAPADVSRLLSDLHGTETFPRQVAADDLANLSETDAAAREALLGVLDDPDTVVRVTARAALEKAGPKSAAALARWDASRKARFAEMLANPTGNDLADLSITLERSGGCQAEPPAMTVGACPGYSLRIYGDGTVRFTPGLGAPKNIPAVAVRRPDDVLSLLQEFRNASFLNMKDEYLQNADRDMHMAGDIAFHPQGFHTLRISMGGMEKAVRRYGGDATIPKALAILEKAVDRLAGVPLAP